MNIAYSLQRLALALLAVVLIADAARAAEAQPYPTRPIRMLVGFPPAGPTDLTARITAQHVTDTLGQQIIVDNRPGASGTVSGQLLARAEPDGYTIALGSGGEIAIAPHLRRKMSYDPLKDFAPVSRIGAGQLVLVVNPAVPAKSTADLVALAKSKPGVVNFASSGSGSTAHLAAELLKHMAAIDIVHVPYKGAGPALIDLISGQVQLLITGYSGAVQHIKSGKLRALGVTGAKRLRAAPELPTIGESVKGYEVLAWYGIFVPARTPQAIISKLHREIAAMARRPQIIERLVALGIEPEGNTPQEFAAQIRSESQKWARIIKLAKVTVE
jgi:tripartite-type tricarboxylate transporter receptor subunit TctC